MDELTQGSADGDAPAQSTRPFGRALRRRHVLIVAAVTVLVLVIVAIYLVLVGPSSASRIGFGVGGTECELTDRRSTFAAGEDIRIAAEFNPELTTGTEVAFRLVRDGVELESYRGTLTLAEATDCIHTTLSGEPLSPGRYRFEVVVASDTIPPLDGAFEISD